MQLKEGMTVIAPEGCAKYLTAGKEYVATNVNAMVDGNYTFTTILDCGEEVYTRLNGSGHLNEGDWIIKPEADSQSLGIYKAIEESFLQNNKTLISLATNKAEIELAEFQCKSNLLNLARLELMLGIKNLTA